MTLSDWLKWKGKRPVDFAEEISVRHPTIYRYMRGKRRPATGPMRRIKEATEGMVTADDFTG